MSVAGDVDDVVAEDIVPRAIGVVLIGDRRRTGGDAGARADRSSARVGVGEAEEAGPCVISCIAIAMKSEELELLSEV